MKPTHCLVRVGVSSRLSTPGGRSKNGPDAAPAGERLFGHPSTTCPSDEECILENVVIATAP